MKKFISNSVDSCLLQASEYFGCPVNHIDYVIIQNPSVGFFGLGKKEAIIIAHWSDTTNDNIHRLDVSNYYGSNSLENKQKHNHRQSAYNVYSQNYDEFSRNEYSSNVSSTKNGYSLEQSNLDNSIRANSPKSDVETQSLGNQAKLFTSSYKPHDSIESSDMLMACQEIQDELVELLGLLPLDIDKIEVRPYNAKFIFIVIDGYDSALLIGQRGYRYKSLSYMLFNWINTCYGYGVYLEIAQFLENQEAYMRTYLKPIIRKANKQGLAQTKCLDGMLAYIALKILRQELPNKYIISHDSGNNEKYITIDSFSKKISHK